MIYNIFHKKPKKQTTFTALFSIAFIDIYCCACTQAPYSYHLNRQQMKCIVAWPGNKNKLCSIRNKKLVITLAKLIR